MSRKINEDHLVYLKLNHNVDHLVASCLLDVLCLVNVLKENQSLILISSNNSYVARFTTTKKLVGSLSILEIVSPISE